MRVNPTGLVSQQQLGTERILAHSVQIVLALLLRYIQVRKAMLENKIHYNH